MFENKVEWNKKGDFGYLPHDKRHLAHKSHLKITILNNFDREDCFIDVIEFLSENIGHRKIKKWRAMLSSCVIYISFASDEDLMLFKLLWK